VNRSRHMVVPFLLGCDSTSLRMYCRAIVIPFK